MRTSNRKPKVPKIKKPTKAEVKKQNQHPHFVLEVQDSVMGQVSAILSKEKPNG